MTVEWERFGEEVEPLSEEMLLGTELVLGVRFPEDYRECVRVNFGAHPVPSEFEIEIRGQMWRGVMGPLLALNPRARYENLFQVLPVFTNEHGLPPEIIPISENGIGDYICLDYRDDLSHSDPRIVYYFHELAGLEGVVPVTSTFTELLRLLKESDD